MVRYAEAIDITDPELQISGQQWLLGYNEDDCAATASVREWLDGPANHLPSIADIPD
jgi:predicted RecB family nuclease